MTAYRRQAKAMKKSMIVSKFDALMKDHQVFKDPDLSLNRVAESCIPVRKYRLVVNQTYPFRTFLKVINASSN
ncbi:hypothetical protein O9993_06700 [Vibrio lentus]|nr:hypothetical protein [Vibrio lentus]